MEIASYRARIVQILDRRGRFFLALSVETIEIKSVSSRRNDVRNLDGFLSGGGGRGKNIKIRESAKFDLSDRRALSDGV